MKNKDIDALDVVEKTGFKLIGGIESMEINLPPKEMIVQEIIGKHKIIALSADTNVGKSIWAHQLGIAVAVGKSDIFGYPISGSKRVLFLNFEMDEHELIERQQLLLMHYLSSIMNCLIISTLILLKAKEHCFRITGMQLSRQFVIMMHLI